MDFQTTNKQPEQQLTALNDQAQLEIIPLYKKSTSLNQMSNRDLISNWSLKPNDELQNSTINFKIRQKKKTFFHEETMKY